jgi:hypothetical protein
MPGAFGLTDCSPFQLARDLTDVDLCALGRLEPQRIARMHRPARRRCCREHLSSVLG